MGGRTVLVAAEIAERPVHACTSSGAARTMRRRATRRGACGRMTGSTMTSYPGVCGARNDKSRRRHSSRIERFAKPPPREMRGGNREHRDATPCIQSSPGAARVNQHTGARRASRSARVTLVCAYDWLSRCSSAQGRPRGRITRREALLRGFVHVGGRAGVLPRVRAVLVELGTPCRSVRILRHLVLLPSSCCTAYSAREEDVRDRLLRGRPRAASRCGLPFRLHLRREG